MPIRADVGYWPNPDIAADSFNVCFQQKGGYRDQRLV